MKKKKATGKRGKASASAKRSAKTRRSTASAKKSRARAGAKKKKSATASAKQGRAKKTAPSKTKHSKKSAAKRTATAKRTVRSTAVKKTAGRASASRNSVPPATLLDPVQFAEERPRKLPKTPLKARELREFKELLLRKRAELVGDVERLTDEALHRRRDGGNDNSTMPIHMADIGSDNWEQDFTLGLIANEQSLVREIDEALQRIADKTYGICLATHKPIGLARLRAKPWARYCIEYARAKEEGRAI